MTETKELQNLIKAARRTAEANWGLIELKQAVEAYDEASTPKPPKCRTFIEMVCKSEHAPPYCSPPWGRTGAVLFTARFKDFPEGADDYTFEAALIDVGRGLSFPGRQHAAIVEAWIEFRDGKVVDK